MICHKWTLRFPLITIIHINFPDEWPSAQIALLNHSVSLTAMSPSVKIDSGEPFRAIMAAGI